MSLRLSSPYLYALKTYKITPKEPTIKSITRCVFGARITIYILTPGCSDVYILLPVSNASWTDVVLHPLDDMMGLSRAFF